MMSLTLLLRQVRLAGFSSTVARKLLLPLLGGMAGSASLPTLPAPAQTFNDTQQHWATPCIERLAAENRLNGYPDGSFRPDRQLTRAEFAVLMLNSFPDVRKQTTVVPQFSDVPSQHWAHRAIQTAYQKRIFVGYPDNTFRPNRPIVRVEALAILATLIPTGYRDRERGLAVPSAPDSVLRGFLNDAAQTPDWSQGAIAAAASGFLIVDYPDGQRLRPQIPSRRADIAAFLCQAFRWDGLVPLTAVVGHQHFTVSPELETLERARANGQAGWFDPQRQRAIVASPPAGWRIAGLDRPAENRVGALLQNSAGAFKQGYFDRAGRLAIAPQFETGGPFSEGLAAVSQNGQYGYIDSTGTWVVPLQFEAAQPFSEGLAAVKLNAQWGFIDRTGAWKIPPQPYAVSPFAEGLARIEVRGKTARQRQYGFIDRTGQLAIAPTLHGASSFSEGLAAASTYDESRFEIRYGYLDKTGTWVIQGLSRMGGNFSEGFAAVQRHLAPVESGKTNAVGDGYIDRTGQWRIPPQRFLTLTGNRPKTLGAFIDGIASISSDQKIGFIDRQGKLVIPLKFSAIRDRSHGYAQVNYGGIWVDYIGGYDGSASPVLETRLESGRWGYVKLSR